jgi:hypothetical protein
VKINLNELKELSKCFTDAHLRIDEEDFDDVRNESTILANNDTTRFLSGGEVLEQDLDSGEGERMFHMESDQNPINQDMVDERLDQPLILTGNMNKSKDPELRTMNDVPNELEQDEKPNSVLPTIKEEPMSSSLIGKGVKKATHRKSHSKRV